MCPTGPFENPFRPGAGHPPPYLAGREDQTRDFERMLKQRTILENLILTGLRGVGKTVLLETFKPRAIKDGWLWVGTDLSESTSLTEDRIAIRLLTDLAVVTTPMVIEAHEEWVGFSKSPRPAIRTLDYRALCEIYEETNGLVSDKLKSVLEFVWEEMKARQGRGIVFAYDEAQNLADHAEKEQYPLSLLLDLFQSIQKRGIPFMLAFTGLPTLFPKLVEARTYTERMFHVITLSHLDEQSSRDAILKPIGDRRCPVQLSDESVATIIDVTGGYPYFIQFICREVYDVWVQSSVARERPPSVPVDAIIRKLDSDFCIGRWSRLSDRHRELLLCAAVLESSDTEFTIQEIVERSKTELKKAFSPSYANQILARLYDDGVVYKNRHGRYTFAVPLMDRFIRRRKEAGDFEA